MKTTWIVSRSRQFFREPYSAELGAIALWVLRQLPLDERKAKLAKLLKASRHSGIALNEHLEADGQRVFWHACNPGFEGIVSKRRDSRYVSGRSKS